VPQSGGVVLFFIFSLSFPSTQGVTFLFNSPLRRGAAKRRGGLFFRFYLFFIFIFFILAPLIIKEGNFLKKTIPLAGGHFPLFLFFIFSFSLTPYSFGSYSSIQTRFLLATLVEMTKNIACHYNLNFKP